MKIPFTTLFLASGIISLFAQHSLHSKYNMFRADDEIIKQQVTYKDPGRSGENVLWDFSRLNTENEAYTLQYAALGDSVIVGTEHSTRYYYSLSNDSLLLLGYENSTTLMENDQPELLMKFPVNYKDSTSCYYSGTGEYCNRLSISAMGTVTTKADACGMMILPDGDTLKNVIRVHTIKRIAEKSRPLHIPLRRGQGEDENTETPTVTPDSINYRLANDTILLELETFRWYTKGYRYPIFETIKSITNKQGQERTFFDTAFFYPPQEHYYLEDDEENLAILEEQKQGKKYNPLEDVKYNVFPNPVNSITLYVEIFLPVEAKIKIQLRSIVNKSVYINENMGKFTSGTHNFQLDVSKLPAGYYLLNIWADNYLFDETVLKK